MPKGALVLRIVFFFGGGRFSLKGSIRATRRVKGLGAFMVRVGFWGPLHYTHDKEPPKIVLVVLKALTLPQLQTEEAMKAHEPWFCKELI